MSRPAFWDRTLSDAKPLYFLSKNGRDSIDRLGTNYFNQSLFTRKGLITVMTVFGLAGYGTTVFYKNKYNQRFEYH